MSRLDYGSGQPAAAKSGHKTVWSAVWSGQMSSVETGQMPAVETGQMSAAETGQMSAAEIS